MVQRDAFKIMQSILEEEGIKLTLEDIKIIMKAFEETCIRVGRELDENEICRIVNFLEISKKFTKARPYKVMLGDNKGETRISEASEHIQVSVSKSFKKKTKVIKE